MYRNWNDCPAGMGSWAGGWWWMTLMVLLWVALLAAIVWAALRLSRTIGERGTTGSHAAAGAGSAPRDLLDRRLATGEIDAEAYDAIRSRLEGRSPGSP